MKKINSKAQIWVETVIYTLIGLSIIGIVLGIVKPALDERRDSISARQSIDLLNYIDSQIGEVRTTGAGNTRQMSIKIGSGKLYVDGINDKILIYMEKSTHELTDPGVETSVGGNIKAVTTKRGSTYNITLTLDYSNSVNITYQGKDTLQIMQAAASPYDIWVNNNGLTGELTNIDLYR